jgi:hypothetical protein
MTDAMWKYYQDAAFPGDTWLQPTFDDAAWPTGEALLYVEEAALPAAKNTPLTLGRLAYYFRTHFNYTGSLDGAQLRLKTIIDDGAVAYLNGTPVFSLAMPNPPITQTTLATRTVGDATLEGPFDVPATGLRQGDNVLAVEVHQTSSGSSDIVLGMDVQVLSTSAASFTPGAPNSVAATLPDFPNLWINELEPVNTSGITDNTGAHDPWVELYNAGDQPVNLDNWSMTDAYGTLDKWIFPAGTTVLARGYLLVWADGESAQSITGQPHTNFRLSAAGGSIALARPQQGSRVVFDYVDYPAISADQSYGSATDGVPIPRKAFTVPTPRAANRAVTPTSPQLIAVIDAAGTVHLSWITQTGVRYRVQATPTLTNPDWQPVFESLGDGSTLRYDDSGAAKERYYRLIAE